MDEEEGHEEDGHEEAAPEEAGHGENEHESFDFGEPADAADADRVIEVVADDDFTFDPAEMTIALGETVTFRVTNMGNLTHDFTLGRSELQDGHDVEMIEMAGTPMADEPNAFLIEPGETRELTWHFSEGGEVLIGCHIPGHYAAGMKSEIAVEG